MDMTNDQRLQLVAFITASASLPTAQGSGNKIRIVKMLRTSQTHTLAEGGTSALLPLAHTCFNQMVRTQTHGIAPPPPLLHCLDTAQATHNSPAPHAGAA